IDLLDEVERQQLRQSWNDTARALPAVTVPELFAQQVERAPGAVAVGAEAEHVPYRALRARANRLARPLIGRGIGPEAIVGVALQRSVDMVASLLAVLEA